MPETSLRHTVFIRKQALKFASAHATVFPDGSKEGLHGHNYSTELTVTLSDISLGKMLSFSELKAALKVVCEEWDEKVLLAEKCPFFEIKHDREEEIEFVLCEKRYVLPRDEVVLLPVENITTENLAAECLRRVIARMEKAAGFTSVKSFEVRIDESPGQGASCHWDRA